MWTELLLKVFVWLALSTKQQPRVHTSNTEVAVLTVWQAKQHRACFGPSKDSLEQSTDIQRRPTALPVDTGHKGSS